MEESIRDGWKPGPQVHLICTKTPGRKNLLVTFQSLKITISMYIFFVQQYGVQLNCLIYP
jgi:hypothetical protein